MGVTDIYIYMSPSLDISFRWQRKQENYNQDLLLTSIAHAQIDVSKTNQSVG